jgi:cytochrome b561
MTTASKRLLLGISSDWCIPMSVAAVGVIGMLDDSWLRRDLASLVEIHALFGLSLWGFVIKRFHSRMRILPHPQAPDIRAVSRHLSRMVYLLLGLLVGFREITGTGTEDLRDYLVYVLAALILVRLLAVFYWRREQRRAPRPTHTPASHP